VYGRNPDAPVFAALCTALDAVIGGAPRPSELRRYELALLGGLGLLPALTHCCACGAAAPEVDATLGFDAGRGGLLCGEHAAGAARVAAAVVAAMRDLAAGGDPGARGGPAGGAAEPARSDADGPQGPPAPAAALAGVLCGAAEGMIGFRGMRGRGRLC
jgi:hypothetical protein